MLSFLMVGCNTMKKLEREAIETAIVGKVSPQQLTAVDGVVNFNYNIALVHSRARNISPFLPLLIPCDGLVEQSSPHEKR